MKLILPIFLFSFLSLVGLKAGTYSAEQDNSKYFNEYFYSLTNDGNTEVGTFEVNNYTRESTKIWDPLVAIVLNRIIKYILPANPIVASGKTIETNLLDKNLIGELRALGVKVTESDVKFVAKNKDNFIMFLERGNSNAGLEHIIERHWNKNELMKFFTTQDEMLKALFYSIKNEKYVAKVLDNQNRLSFIYQLQTNQGVREFTVAIGSNGFIVSLITK